MGFSPSADGAPGTGFARRNRIDIRGSLLSETVREFPLLVKLRSPDFDGNGVQPDGADIRVYAADQITELPYEIEHISATGADIWVRVLEIASGTDEMLWVAYGDPSAPAGQRADQVWATTEYTAVWHLVDGHDSTANHLDGTFSGTVVTTGIAGLARDLQLGWLEVGDTPALAMIGASGQTTWSAWARPQTFPSGTSGLIDRRTEATSLDDFRFGPTSLGDMNGQINVDPGQRNLAFGGGNFTFGVWHLFAMTYDGSDLRASIDGTMVASAIGSGSVHASANSVWLGGGCNGCAGQPNDDRMDGVLDEVRIESVIRSDGWLAAEYLNLTGLLVTVHPFEE